MTPSIWILQFMGMAQSGQSPSVTIIEVYGVLHVQETMTTKLNDYFPDVSRKILWFCDLLMIQLLMNHGGNPTLLSNGYCTYSLALGNDNNKVNKLNHLIYQVGKHLSRRGSEFSPQLDWDNPQSARHFKQHSSHFPAVFNNITLNTYRKGR